MSATLTTTNALCDDPIGGLLTVQDGILYYLTRCCGASGKGSANVASGVCCRACYREVDAVYGTGWLVSDDAGWAAYAERLLPHLQHLTDKMVVRTKDAALARS